MSNLLAAERAALSKTGLSSCWLAEDGGASGADDNGLGVGEDSGDGEASWALDVHEEGSWCWNKVLFHKSVYDFFYRYQTAETAIWFIVP